MNRDPEKNEETIFYSALELTSPAARAAYLQEACGDDRELLQRVRALLRVDKFEDDFLENPPTILDLPVVHELPEEIAGSIIDRYKLLEKIGEGGMAVVYMAQQEQPIRRKVALKIIKLGMDTRQVIARFEAERQALALMDHPNIAKVLDAGATETGRPYFVMELVTGVSITEYCDKNNLSNKDRLALFIQVCSAVQHAHQRGIIHRDIKPSNVMVTRRDGIPVPKVIDFGIAKATNQRLTEKTLFTRYAHIIGTPAYMSPEQAWFSDVGIDKRTDIYSLGVLLYELLTSTTPFTSEQLNSASYDEICRIIRDTDPPKPSTRLTELGRPIIQIAGHRQQTPDNLKKSIRGDLDWIIMKALEKDRNRRYETAADLAMDIERYLQDRPVLAGPPSTVYRVQKFTLRHRWPVLTAAFGVCATLTGAAFMRYTMWPTPGSLGRQQHASGMVMRQMWNLPQGGHLSGTVSVDGRYLSYVDWTAGNLAAYDLVEERHWLVTNNTDQTWKTIEGWNESSVVSPDGQRIAYSWYNEEGMNFYDLRIIDLDGRNMRVLYHDKRTHWILPYAWSPDSEHILAYLSDREEDRVDEHTGQPYRTAHLGLISTLDGSVRILKTWERRAHVNNASFSLDGRTIAYDLSQEDNQQHNDIFLISVDGSYEIPLVDHTADDKLVGWTPDGNRIIFVSDRTSRRGIWMVHIVDGIPQGPEELVQDNFNHRAVGFDTQGSLYYGVSTHTRNVLLVSLDSTSTMLADSPRLASSLFVGTTGMAAFSPDGKCLVYLTRRPGQQSMDVGDANWGFVVLTLATGQERIVTPSPAIRATTHIHELCWAPDGHSWLMCGSLADQGQGVFTMDVGTGAVARLGPLKDKPATSVAFSPDGISVYIRRMESISRLDLASVQETELYKGPRGPAGFDVSPDGQWLAFYPQQDSLAIMPATGGESREIVQQEFHGATALVRWTPNGERLLFCKKGTELWQVDVQSGQQHRIAVLDQDLTHMAIHPQGLQVACTLSQTDSQLWVLKNFLP